MSKAEQCLMKLRHNGKVYNVGDPAPSASKAELESWRAAGVIGRAAGKAKSGSVNEAAADQSAAAADNNEAEATSNDSDPSQATTGNQSA